jgi:hypothetical protein
VAIFEANRGHQEKGLGNKGLHKGQRHSPESIMEKVQENYLKMTKTDKAI